MKKISKVDKSQHFTKPPSRYSEASLVKELEKRSIGRPSTYQEIITNIQDRGYVNKENKRLYATKIANLISDRLLKSFKNIMDYGFTAEMEKSLDEVAEGKESWKKLLEDFYTDFNKAKELAADGMERNKPILTEVKCDACNKDRKMHLRTNQNGQFLGCEGYLEEGEEQCKNTNSVLPDELFTDNDDKEAESIFGKTKCHLCGSSMDGYIIDEKRKLHICSSSPICSGTKLEEGNFIKPKNGEEELIDCHKCDAQMELKLGRFGKYFACQSCTATRQLMKDGKLKPVFMDPIEMADLKCQKCDDIYLLRDSLKGLFLAASQFPKNRETRAPLVGEVKSVLSKLPEKHQIFSSAPDKDPDGDDLVVRFNRKDGSQTLSAESKGKKKKLFYIFDGSNWKEMQRD
jgi:DNA topoisomerase-1